MAKFVLTTFATLDKLKQFFGKITAADTGRSKQDRKKTETKPVKNAETRYKTSDDLKY